MENYDEIQLRSEELQDIIGKPPSWIIRRGIILMFFIIVSLLSLTIVIKYPYVIDARVTITTITPPLNVQAKYQGKVFLLCKEGEKVDKGRVIGGIQTAADYRDILFLKENIAKLQQAFIKNDYSKIDLEHDYQLNLNLGELQPSYINLLKSLDDKLFYERNNVYAAQIEKLNHEIDFRNKLEHNLNSERHIYTQDFDLAKERFKMDSTLYTDGKLISKQDLNNSNQIYNQSKLGLQKSLSSGIDNRIQVSTLQSQIAQLRTSSFDKERELNNSVKETIKTANTQIRIWEDRYLFIAPVDGTVNYFNIWSNNQVIAAGENVAKVIPSSNSLYCKALVPVVGSGKLAVGQKAMIKIDNFPYTEYGVLKGTVKSISLVPVDNHYSVLIYLPNRLKTSYNKNLDFKQEMQGSAQIITSTSNVLNRIFANLITIMENRSNK